jgi:hypothetical protein
MCCFVGDGLLLPLKKWDWFWAFEIYPGACLLACLLVFLKTKKKKASMQGKAFCNLKENKHNNFYC